MKQRGWFSELTAVGLVLGVSSFLISSAQAEVGKAVVRAIRGSADFTQGEGWRVMRVGTVLRPGAKIRTAPQSEVDLFLDQNGPVVRVTESTELGIDRLNFEETGVDVVIETQLDLTEGRILGYVKKTSAASRYEIKTPNGVAGIRGTEYDISVSGLLKVISGEMVIVFIDPTTGIATTSMVNAGEQFNPTVRRVEPITPGDLANLLPVFREIQRWVEFVTELFVIPPVEPFVSAIVDSGRRRRSEPNPILNGR